MMIFNARELGCQLVVHHLQTRDSLMQVALEAGQRLPRRVQVAQRVQIADKEQSQKHENGDKCTCVAPALRMVSVVSSFRRVLEGHRHASAFADSTTRL